VQEVNHRPIFTDNKMLNNEKHPQGTSKINYWCTPIQRSGCVHSSKKKKIKRDAICFHPQKRIEFDFLHKSERICCLILEDVIVPIFPYHPNTSIPYAFKIRMCTPRKSRHIAKLKHVKKSSIWNSLGLTWWYWLETWECALPRGLKFDSLRCQFRWANLTFSKKNLVYVRITYEVKEQCINVWKPFNHRSYRPFMDL
jgi:hypothetical protein